MADSVFFSFKELLYVTNLGSLTYGIVRVVRFLTWKLVSPRMSIEREVVEVCRPIKGYA